MKSSTMIFVLSLAVLLTSFTPSLGRKYCPATPIPRQSACGSTGQDECYSIVLQYPASAMPTNIRCVDVGKNRSECTFFVVCS
ncbi:hypothetical protein PHJA_002204100 [Phtheirospermum japonicum]|uniref:Uncharacterized protein n=1 Tax=Phtheirospermum japonicum TaxID=374723 RepID=A0A830D2K2_9LAMI|nr:hypothetical protein PHJA_002204100 [Phtheirospermum japonicum]